MSRDEAGILWGASRSDDRAFALLPAWGLVVGRTGRRLDDELERRLADENGIALE